jgi:hypothetical protein
MLTTEEANGGRLICNINKAPRRMHSDTLNRWPGLEPRWRVSELISMTRLWYLCPARNRHNGETITRVLQPSE